jgi:hypothetical protein
MKLHRLKDLGFIASKLVLMIDSFQYRSRVEIRALIRTWTPAAFALACESVLSSSLAAAPAPASKAPPGVMLSTCHVEGVKEELHCGVYSVFENRRTREGQTLPLKIVLIPARHPHPQQGPIFYMAGGPGETATELADFVIGFGDRPELRV